MNDGDLRWLMALPNRRFTLFPCRLWVVIRIEVIFGVYAYLSEP